MSERKRTQEEINADKSAAMKRRWAEHKAKNGNGQMISEDRPSKRFNYKCFEGLNLSNKQKQFVVIFMDPPYYGRKENRYEAFKKVYEASNENSLRANCSTLMAKSKIKEAILKYQKHALENQKVEVTTESIENLRRRANYDISTFYHPDGRCKNLDEIPAEWLICIDNIKIDKKPNAGKTPIETKEYKLCDRDKASTALQKLLGIQQEMENMTVSIPTGGAKNAIESVGTKDKEESGPKITMNFSVSTGDKQ